MENGKDFIREIRINPILPDEPVIVTTERGKRPKKEAEPLVHDGRAHVENCPFCSGNEAMTPPSIVQVPITGSWQLRIIKNLYPMLGDDRLDRNFNYGMHQTFNGYGRHDVIVDHFNHGIRIHEMSEDHLVLLLATYRNRAERLYHNDDQLKYVVIFKNYGPAAGASIAHTHSQIVATPVVPRNLQAELHAGNDFFRKNQRCIFCDLIDEMLTFEVTLYDKVSQEVKRKVSVGQFIVDRSERFIAIKPFASRYEWEVHILPLVHQADFIGATPDDLADLARLFKRVMARLNAVLGGLQYNFFFHSLPHGKEYAESVPAFHWHIEICPRTSIPAGFELGSGFFVNTIAPEEAAERLRNVHLD